MFVIAYAYLCQPYSMKVIVADEGLTSSALSINFTIMPTDDEPPIISQTATEQTYIENAGPVNVADQTAIIVDADNLAEHRDIQELRVRLVNPAPGDELIDFAGAVSSSHLNYSCDVSQNATCYEMYLRSVQFNNLEDEPEIYNRYITIEVGLASF